MSKNSNTMKNGRNPETHEVIDEVKDVEPLAVTLDASPYSEIPAVQEATGSGVSTVILLSAAAAVLAVIIVTFLFVRRRQKSAKQVH